MTIYLRSIEERDLAQLRDWRNGNRLRSSCREYRLLNMINQRDWLEQISRDPKVEMFGVVQQTELVGVCGLCNVSWIYRTAEVTIYVAPNVDDTTVAVQALKLLKRKAFEEFNLHRLWAEVYEFHIAKITLLEQHDFVLEGRLREHIFKLGKRQDSLMYGLLRR